MAQRELVWACYRSLLRWTRVAQRIPFGVKKDHLRLVSPDMADAKVTIQDAATFRNVVRWSFRANRELDATEAEDALTRAVLALRLLNTLYTPQLAEAERKRRDHTDVRGIHYAIGQVVRHKREGYRGVVSRWDRVCRYPQYLSDTDVNFVQPFYNIIPDDNDAIRSFGGPRVMQYVAQEDLQSVDEPFKVSNRYILSHFESYSPKLGRYLPKAPLRYEYPGEYCEDDLQPCEGAEAEVKEEDRKENEKPRRRKAPRKKSKRYTQQWPNPHLRAKRASSQPKVEGRDKLT